MKKIFTLLAFGVAMMGAANAQRVVDIEVVDLLSPTTIYSSQNFTVEAVIKNIGPDATSPNDTFGIRAAIVIGTQTILIPGPNANTLIPYKVNKSLATNDTTLITLNVNGFPFTGQGQANFSFIAFCINTGTDSVANEGVRGTSNNNIVTEQVTMDGTTGINGDIQLAGNYTLAPNPATNSFEVQGVIVKETQLVITDLSGREVARNIVSSLNRSVDISALPAGVYMVQLNSEAGVQTLKLQKN